MKNIYLQIHLLAIACLLSASVSFSQICDPTKQLFPVQAHVNTGGSSRISSNNFQMATTVGNAFIGSSRNNTIQPGSYSMEFGFWSFMMLEPNTPVVNASDGDYPDRIEVRWDPIRDPIGPPITGEILLYRDGQFLATFPITQTAYLDFNVIPGQSYRYDVVTKNNFGNSIAGNDIGFVNPNGVITGTIQTRSFIPVPDVEVVLTPAISYSLGFNGVNDKIVLTDSAVNNVRAGTMEFWVYPTKLTNSTILAKRRVIGEGALLPKLYSVISIGSYPNINGNPVTGAPGKIYYYAKSGTQAVSSKRALPLHSWSHVSIAFDSSRAIIYINGMFDNEVLGDYSIPADRSPRDARPVRTYAGYWEGVGNYFQGNLDEFRCWNTIRTNDEIIENKDRTVDSDHENLFLYWKFDEGQGSRAYDLSLKKNHGLLCTPMAFTNIIKAPVYTSGITNTLGNFVIKGINYGSGKTFTATPRKLSIIGRALEFDGVNDYVEVPHLVGDTALNTGTIETWVYPRRLNSQPIIALRNDGGNSSGILSIENSRLRFTSRGVTVAMDATQLDTAFWYHVAVKFTATKVTFYINGELSSVVNGDFTIGLGRASAKATIGKYGTNNFYGRIDEVRVWNSERTQQQIQQFMNAPFTTDQDGMEAYWKLNEGGGFSVSDETPNLYVGNIHNADSTVWSKRIPMNETFAHTFQPQSRDVTLAPSNTVVDGIDFTDISLLAVSGFVKYIGTNCFVDSAEVLIDGISSAPQAFTQSDGKFTVEFEPGTTHKISFKKENHSFAPAFYEIKNIAEPLVVKNPFLNTSTNTISGDVAGGKCKLPIGVSEVRVQSVNGCLEAKVFTDVNGHYSIPGLPPLNYNIFVTHPNPIITFDGEQISLKEGDDSIDFIYIAPMQVNIEVPPPSTCITVDTVFNQGRRYPIVVKIFEEYGSEKCYIDSGNVSVTDYLSVRKKNRTFQSGIFRDTIFAQNVNIIPPYKLQYEVVATDAIERQQSKRFYAVVTGAKPRGQTYAATSPLRPLRVIHDPPGDASYAFFMKDSTYSLTSSNSYAHQYGASLDVEVNLGPSNKTVIGFGVATVVDFEVHNSVTASGAFSKSFTNSGEEVTSFTFSSQYSTSSSEDFIGDSGDVYLGYSKVTKYGIADKLYVDTSNCSYASKPIITVSGDSIKAMYLYSQKYLGEVELPRLDSLAINTSIDTTQRKLFARTAEAWRMWMRLNDSLKQVASFQENITWDAGAIIDNTVQVASEATSVWEETWDISEDLVIQFGLSINSVGIATTVGAHFGQSITRGGSGTQSSSNTWGYHLEDDDEGDVHGVSIKKDANGAPVFKLIGGETSCPHEPNTLAREGVQIAVSPSTAINIPPEEPAVFTLNLGNTSPTNEDATYNIKVVQASNPDGAVIAVNGVIIEDYLAIDIPAGQQVSVTMTVLRGPIAYDYDDLEIQLVSQCDENISDTATFSVHYEVPCSKVEMNSPTNNWLVTSNDADTVYLTLSGYDRLNPDFKEIKIQYRELAIGKTSSTKENVFNAKKIVIERDNYFPIGTSLEAMRSVFGNREVQKGSGGNETKDNPWINAIVIAKDSLPDNQNYIIVPWNVSPDVVPDGEYELRAISTCFAQTIIGTSIIAQGIIDRTGPQVFGTPSPIDGVLGPNDEIAVTFDEDIDGNDLNGLLNVKLINAGTGQEIDKNFSFTYNSLSIVPNIQTRFIENKTLRAKIIGLKDVYGNERATDVVWEFYVDKNPMRWNDPKVTITKNEGEPISFTRTLVNSGGSSMTFSLSSLPSWLIADPMMGTIPPGFSQIISFQASEQLSGGLYKDTAFAETAQGNEDIVFNIRVLCQSPQWSVNPSNYQYSMNIVAELSVDNIISDDIYDKVSALVGNEVRGVQSIQYVPAFNRYEIFMTIFSNQVSGEMIRFKVWDASSCRELVNVYESYTFTANANFGTPSNPTVITATNEVLQKISLSQGWSWFSLNLKNNNMSVNTILDRVTLSAGNIIKGQTTFSQAVPGFGWIGTLSALNNKTMYQVKLNEKDTIEMSGYPVAFPDTIPIVQGWNWIGYQPQTGMELNYALASLPSLNGDIIKSQSAFSIYIAPHGWIGSLSLLSPKLGYLLKAGTPSKLIYPPASIATKSVVALQPSVPKTLPEGWSVNPSEYQYSMQCIGEVNTQGIVPVDSLDAIGVFLGNECRGVVQPIYVQAMDKYLFFLLAYSNTAGGEELHFKFFDHASQQFFGTSQTVHFSSDSLLGTVLQPFVWNVTPLGVKNEKELPKEFALAQNYPNPFNPLTTIKYAVPKESFVEISIYDILGQKVRTLVAETQTAGFKSVMWNGISENGNSVGSGMYIYRMIAGDFVATRKLVIVK